MKKLLIAACLFLGLALTTTAQTTPAKAKTDTTKTATHLKADGTPDMRYKANKDAAKPAPAGPLKKDGTPDMRYKANKTDSTKKK
ncbi:MAG TPA: hypothetical protein VK559_05965 [Ferruginibacter sp.]|nr:hypothetical protein [Ferruginibacter sp.]